MWRAQYQFNGQLAAQNGNSGWFYLHRDHLGSATVTSYGTVSSNNRTNYDSWGKVTSGGLPATTLSFTGQKLDGTGLLDYHARMYDPVLGRFISPDSIIPSPGNPQSLNRYSYVLNNPLNYTDPTGHCTEGDTDCWAVYGKVMAKISLNYSPAGLDKWEASPLNHLLMWLTGGGINFTGTEWTADRIHNVMQSLDRVRTAFGGDIAKLRGALGGSLAFDRRDPVCTADGCQRGGALPWDNKIILSDFDVLPILHEIGHVVDWNLGGRSAFWSERHDGDWAKAAGWDWLETPTPRWNLRQPENAPSAYAITGGPREDFAETFTLWVEAKSGGVLRAAGDPNPYSGDWPRDPSREKALTKALGL